MPDDAVITYAWRGEFADDAINALHAEAFDHGLLDLPWRALVERHSLGWVTALDEAGLVGFVNVPWDGDAHAWIQDTMVAGRARRRGIGSEMIRIATEATRRAGCEWLHVDFDDDLAAFYLDACGFRPARAGLIQL